MQQTPHLQFARTVAVATTVVAAIAAAAIVVGAACCKRRLYNSIGHVLLPRIAEALAEHLCPDQAGGLLGADVAALYM